MLGMAQRLFAERYTKNPWKIHTVNQDNMNWPLLEKMVEAQCLGYIDFALAERILKTVGRSDEAAAALICHLSMAARQGHLCATIENATIIPAPQDIWLSNNPKEDQLPISAEIWKSLCSLISSGTTSARFPLLCNMDEDPSSFAPICKWKNHYYLQRNWMLESNFVDHIQPLLRSQTHPRIIPAITRARTLVEKLILERKLLPEQASAVIQGCENLFTIIIGGPGTGKTYTAGILLRTFWESLSSEQQAICRIQLAAPTGKAAANLESSIRQAFNGIEGAPQVNAQTLHLLLDVRKNSRHKTAPMLNADILLVDESSMIDVRLMGTLMAALKPGARLILLGDKHQLPPIEAGSLFADLVHHLQSHGSKQVVELKICMRAELKEIVEAAQQVNIGEASQFLDTLNTSVDGICLTSLGDVATPQKVQNKLLTYAFPRFPKFERCENPLEALAAFARFRILTPLRKGPLGTEKLNDLFYAESYSHAQHGECFVVPIMIVRNHYRLRLFNGEVGLLIKFNGSPSKDFALFASRGQTEEVCNIPALMLPAYEYAYCISIHKSQGSEFEHVLMLLPEGSETFGREALYTGMTRARRSLEVWSTPSILQTMINRRSLRHSSVGERLSLNNNN